MTTGKIRIDMGISFYELRVRKMLGSCEHTFSSAIREHRCLGKWNIYAHTD